MIDVIEHIFCSESRIKPKDLHTKNRKREYRELRQYTMYFAMELGYSERAAAEYYGFDHSTANHSKKVINGQCDVDINFAKKIKSMRAKLDRYKLQTEKKKSLFEALNELKNKLIKTEVDIQEIKDDINNLYNSFIKLFETNEEVELNKERDENST